MLESLYVSFYDEARMIKIGFVSVGNLGDPQQSLEAHPAFYPKREDFQADGPTRKCPAFHDYVMGSFSIGIAYNLRFCVRKSQDGKYWVEYDRSFTSLPEPILPNCLNLDNIEYGVVQLNIHPNWMFISDTPNVHMIVIPASGQTNPEPFRGHLNIYNWFRHTSYAFRVKIDEWVTVSKDSPIMAVKFVHPEETHFVIKEVRKTREIESRAQFMVIHNLVGSQTFSRWKDIFKFNGKRRPKKVLEFIEDGE